jgi:hypothetical protein
MAVRTRTSGRGRTETEIPASTGASYEITARTVKFLARRGNGGGLVGEPPLVVDAPYLVHCAVAQDCARSSAKAGSAGSAAGR